jgi:hypothetical protein
VTKDALLSHITANPVLLSYWEELWPQMQQAGWVRVTRALEPNDFSNPDNCGQEESWRYYYNHAKGSLEPGHTVFRSYLSLMAHVQR